MPDAERFKIFRIMSHRLFPKAPNTTVGTIELSHAVAGKGAGVGGGRGGGAITQSAGEGEFHPREGISIPKIPS